jgi:hypothetical protein
MNRYEPTPANFRFAAAVGAALLTVATFAISTYAPATLPLDTEAGFAVETRVAATPTEATIIPNRIEVVGHREKRVAWAPALVVER